jgi:hypothetical protein
MSCPCLQLTMSAFEVALASTCYAKQLGSIYI